MQFAVTSDGLIIKHRLSDGARVDGACILRGEGGAPLLGDNPEDPVDVVLHPMKAEVLDLVEDKERMQDSGEPVADHWLDKDGKIVDKKPTGVAVP